MRAQLQAVSLTNHSSIPIALFNSQQVYAMEQAWFAQGYDSFALMQQAAWQMTQHIIQRDAQKSYPSHLSDMNNPYQNYPYQSSSYQNNFYKKDYRQRRASIWVGQGNNGGDGWLIAYYLQQAGWQVEVITVGLDKFDTAKIENSREQITDAIKAQQMALEANCHYQRFEDSAYSQNNSYRQNNKDDKTSQSAVCFTDFPSADVYVDAIFGIGLDRAPAGSYKQAIRAFNKVAKRTEALVVAVDIPSGLVATTGQVFDCVAIQADVTLCLIARKFGLHTKDGMDYAGAVLDIPLIPYKAAKPVATLLSRAYGLSARRQNSYKGSYGHVLIIGGNRIDGSQGMGGAAILSASSAMATGAGKITVACHQAFHGALLTSLPDAMTIDLHDVEGVEQLIKDASIIAIGMGLGRDKKAQDLFISYLQAAMAQHKPIIIDADGFYHLASLQADNHQLVAQLRKYSKEYQVCLTPHSGEAARLLDKEVQVVERDRLAAIKQCAAIYGGAWVLKGAGSLVLEQEQVYVCALGNAGMATAGMGDILSGITAGILAQQDLEGESRSLRQAVLIHGLAGNVLASQPPNISQHDLPLLIGQRGLQAQDMPAAIRHVMQLMTD